MMDGALMMPIVLFDVSCREVPGYVGEVRLVGRNELIQMVAVMSLVRCRLPCIEPQREGVVAMLRRICPMPSTPEILTRELAAVGDWRREVAGGM
jgi:hypothetical protein